MAHLWQAVLVELTAAALLLLFKKEAARREACSRAAPPARTDYPANRRE